MYIYIYIYTSLCIYVYREPAEHVSAAGLGALALAEESVNTMKVELIALQPGLVKAQEETGELTAKVLFPRGCAT